MIGVATTVKRAAERGIRLARHAREHAPKPPKTVAPNRLPESPRRPPGTAKASMFFDDFPRFYTTSSTSAFRGRLNLRYEAIFADNRDIFAGARVLDIASHDGRWSLAALRTGAASVLGIEGREDLVAKAEENLRHYGEDESRWRFVAGDIFDALAREPIEADVVLCLGFLYHTLRYNELLGRIRAINPRYVLVDTLIMPGASGRVVRVVREPVEREANAIEDPYTHGGKAVVGIPSAKAVEFLLESYGFELDRYADWPALLRDNPRLGGAGAYRKGGRATARFVSRA